MERGDHRTAPVRVEVLVVGACAATVYYRRVCATLARDTHPDVAAAQAVQLVGSSVSARPVAVSAGQGGVQRDGPQPDWAPPPLTMLHSTSWRFDEGAVVLTYVAVLDGVPGADSVLLVSRDVARSGDPAVPSPPEITLYAVAAHALRHLAWLRERDEVVATALASAPFVWDALDGVEPSPAGAVTAARRVTAVVR
ncbi:hypothetical protein ABZS66_55000 [Dactylosporangium sp. NPDC005572]|uniref:hypothetical protein n=1 Tax=Dactylosporangium sp. NPDC005572 TaxID=3156889 RepID=UPI00339F1D72